MPKRFTHTDKWKDVWFQSLPLKYKLFWLYLLDECDNSGVWKPNMGLAQFQIGEPFEEVELRRILADRIEILPSGYWFISKFIDFQYGELSPASKPHASVLWLLTRHGIKGYPKGIHTIKDKDKDTDKDTDKDKDKDKGSISDEIFADQQFIESLTMTHKGKDIRQAWEECFTHHSNSPNPPQEVWQWRQKLNTWLTIKKVEKTKSDKPHYKVNV